jgi:hypothetical protein
MTRLVFALAIATLPLAAQTSSLQGIVTDAQGGAVPSAVVTATNTSTSAPRKALSDSTGAYSMLQMAPGTYRVTVEKPGFRSHASEVVLQTETPETLNIKLEIGQVTDSVNVTGEAAVVNTENAAVGNPFNETQVKEIPLQTRNIVSLLSVEPGVAPSGQVAGARADQNNVTLDGVDVNNGWGNSSGGTGSSSTSSSSVVHNADGFNAAVPIPLDSVQEFRTTVVGVGADQGYSAGGQVSIVTKSGSNTFHGSVYEYNRNTLTTANSWGNNEAGTPRPALVRNQYGASLGGPILKNRLFFFYNYEGRTDRSANSETDQVPSPLFSQGIVQVALKGSNQIVQLTPAMVQAIDPLGIGENPYILGLMKDYPAGNYPLGGTDKGLNFWALTFNAPDKQDYHAQVGRMDFNIDPAGKHTLMVRGTLNGASVAGNGNGGGLSQFPGQAAAYNTLDNSRGMAARYTAVLTPHLVNALTYGYTRLGVASTGLNSVIPSFGFTTLQSTARASQQIAPTSNVNDDLTWTKGRHTAQFGISFRFSENDNHSFNNYPSFSFSRNTLLGLGNDIDNDVLSFIQTNLVPGATALANNTYTTEGFGAIFGILNNWGATFHYLINGQTIPFGNPYGTAFVNHEYEGYAQDAFKWKRNFTITYGLRYSLYGVPYEKNGQQVVPQTPLSNYFAQRVWAQENGVPNSSLPDSLITYQIGGPVNHGPGYYPADPTLFAPRLALAYSPDADSLLAKIFGQGSVWRAGSGIVYDHYGAALSEAFSQSGSPGLASTVAQPVNTNFTSTFRYNGTSLPSLAAPAAFTFPYTPPTIIGGFDTFTGIQSNLKAPYEYVMNATYARPLPKHLSIELGYIGRLGRRGIVQQDFGQPLEDFKDPKSGQTLSQAGAALASIYNKMISSGMSPAQASAAVKSNPSLVPLQPFIEDMFPGTKNYLINGSPSANFFYDWYDNFSGSFTDTINDMDRTRQSLAGGGCFSIDGCNTFFPLQNSGLPSYTNAGTSSFNAATVVLRRAVQHGWGFDFNYTFGHALDNGSTSESGGGAALQDAFNPGAFKGPSDFDAKHTVTFDYVVLLPVGRGQALWNSMPKLVDYALGGWQVSGLTSFRSGTPLTISDSGVYNTNYDYSSYAILAPGATMPKSGLTTDQNGIPSIFSNTDAINDFVASNPGTVGTRGILRGFNSFNTDLAVSKYFHITERHRLQLRAEAFNAFNRVNFNNPASNLNIANPTSFGEISLGNNASAPARVMQFAARYEF